MQDPESDIRMLINVIRANLFLQKTKTPWLQSVVFNSSEIYAQTPDYIDVSRARYTGHASMTKIAEGVSNASAVCTVKGFIGTLAIPFVRQRIFCQYLT